MVVEVAIVPIVLFIRLASCRFFIFRANELGNSLPLAFLV
jgi:hypothetical protein